MAKAIPYNEYIHESHFRPEEVDDVKAVLAYVLMEHTEMDADTIYSLIFQNGTRITWH